ncbi:MAG: hypothetical protein PHN82_03140 [bacterium]|nr:hypothetical protein [bacterium]
MKVMLLCLAVAALALGQGCVRKGPFYIYGDYYEGDWCVDPCDGHGDQPAEPEEDARLEACVPGGEGACRG